MPLTEAMNIIRNESDRHFDPEVVAAFLQIGPDIYTQTIHASEGELRQHLLSDGDAILGIA